MKMGKMAGKGGMSPKMNPMKKGALPSGGTAKGGGTSGGSTTGGPMTTGKGVVAVRNKMPKAR